MITLLIITNGRKEYLERTLATLHKVHGDITRTTVYDDSDKKQGFTKAMISAWDILKHDDNEWVFHLEEDFEILEDVYLGNMISVMNKNKGLKQIVLQRQGGIISKHPERYTDKTDGINHWVEHRVGWSCNPCLYRRSQIETPWPDEPNSERAYGKKLLKDPATKFAYWGKTTDKPKVFHIGENRTGFGY